MNQPRKYLARFNTQAEVTVYVTLPDDFDFDNDDPDEYVAETAHDLASEHLETWGIHAPVLLGMSIDGVGADTIEPVEVGPE